MPMNTHTVTSIMFLTCVIVSPSGAPSICVVRPQKSAENSPALNPTAAMAMNTRIGTTFATVTTTLTKAAVWTPRSVMACTIHSTTDAPMIAGTVAPPSKTGKK